MSPFINILTLVGVAATLGCNFTIGGSFKIGHSSFPLFGANCDEHNFLVGLVANLVTVLVWHAHSCVHVVQPVIRRANRSELGTLFGLVFLLERWGKTMEVFFGSLEPQ
jgi:hypothetical protein